MINFTKEECNKIISLSNLFQKHLSNEWWKSNETIYSAWHIERTEITEWIFKRLLNYLKMDTTITLNKPLNMIHLQNVQKGNKFERHIDKHSLYNIGACLNDDYEGGNLICYNPKFILPKITGSIYTFYGGRLHEVTEVTSGERWSLIAFLSKDLLTKKIYD